MKTQENNKSYRDVRIWCFDTETYLKVDQPNPSSSAEILDSRVYGVGWLTDYEDYRYSFGTDAIKHFVEDLKRQTGTIVLYAHNASYDCPFLIRELVEGEHGFKFQFKFTEQGILFVGNFERGKNLKLYIGDTLFWNLNMSLKSWGEALGGEQKEKLTDIVKYNLEEENGKLYYRNKDWKLKELNLEEEYQYLRRDVELVKRIVNELEQNKKDLGQTVGIWNLAKLYKIKSQFIVSAPRAVKDIVDHQLDGGFQKVFRPNVPLTMYTIMHGGYLGGFTSGSKNFYKYNGKLIYVDVNSFYPYIMSQGIPCGLPQFTKPKNKAFITWYVVVGTKCVWKDKWSFFDNEFLGKSFRELNGDSEFIMLRENWDLMEEMCEHDLEIVHIWYQELSFVLSPFIVSQYAKRKEYKEKVKSYKPEDMKDIQKRREYLRCKSLESTTKLMLNSLYGKFAEQYHRHYVEITDKNPKMTKLENEDTERPSLLAGAYVTAMARYILMSTIKKEVENGNEFIYCDTDSITLKPNVPLSMNLDNEELGAWKIEHEYENGAWRYNGKHKKYVLWNEVDGEIDRATLKLTTSGLAIKDQIKEWSKEDIETLFDRENNVYFVGCKNAGAKIPGDDFNIPVILKTDYTFNTSIPRITHYCRYPYSSLEKNEEKE